MESWYTSAQAYLEEQESTVKLTSRKDPNFEALRVYFARKLSEEPALIARPQTVEDVQSLVRYCSENEGIDFVVCTGPHDSPGNTKDGDVLWIDMRDIDYVEVADDGATAKLGVGIAFRGLTNVLLENDLAIPNVILANAGYTWTPISPFSTRYGLSASQVISVKLVNSEGCLLEADGQQLDYIMQIGSGFGVIVELTIEVCSLKKMFSSSDESSDADVSDMDAYDTDAYEADISDTNAH
ncbi:hypothetical protein F4680DRAFT_453325 [Xylaria scruposa]|nr:hypothetical protein F4680DRAFT_453325 [Xylaria scruposa]